MNPYTLDCPRCGEQSVTLLIKLTPVLKREDGTGIKFAPMIKAICNRCGKYIKHVEVTDETVTEAVAQSEAWLAEKFNKQKAEELGLEKLPFEE